MTDAIELGVDNLLVAHADEILLYSLESDTTSILNVYNPYSESVTFKSVNDKKYMLIGNALYLINYKGEKVSFEKIQETNIVNSFLTQNDNLWIKSENSGFKYFGNSQIPDKVFSFLKAFDNITDIQLDNNGNLWMVENYENIYQLNTSDFEKYKIDVNVIIKEIRTQSGEYLPWKNVKLKYSDNALTFVVVSPSYLKFNSNQYQYLIEGLMENWSDWSSENIISVPFLPPGNFKFKVRAKNLFGEISESESFSFKIIPPFWRTPYFYIICAILIILGFHLRQRYKMFKHIQEKEILQQKVKERTIELELKNKAITDSIVYAERMQRGILPANDILTSCLKEYFVLYMPKNIVSGDFYWLSQKEKITYVVAADCTGHGVPGAFMSMLGVAYLNEIIRSLSSSNTTAAEILENLRERITKLFSQETFITNDGIDIALLIIDSSNKKIQYAGAYNPLYQITSNKNTLIDKEKIAGVNDKNILAVYKADKFHVGKAARNFRKFTNHIIPYNEDDTFYIFSDGFVDQFGGAEESKFMYGPFRNLILEISEKPMEIQKKELLTRFNEWKGEIEQTDDILILGLKP
jgi:serine phosphatase RsbU (regulator of sigma subunit)